MKANHLFGVPSVRNRQMERTRESFIHCVFQCDSKRCNTNNSPISERERQSASEIEKYSSNRPQLALASVWLFMQFVHICLNKKRIFKSVSAEHASAFRPRLLIAKYSSLSYCTQSSIQDLFMISFAFVSHFNWKNVCFFNIYCCCCWVACSASFRRY